MFPLFRRIAMYEGVSYLLLLFIAMPLKYFADMPMAVTIIGGAHGALFVAFIILSYLVKDQHGKSLWWMIKAFLASIIPFGTFYMDREWGREAASY